ncbi:MAG: thermonuclease family protein [Candidatus Hadarchaeales archaeon]
MKKSFVVLALIPMFLPAVFFIPSAPSLSSQSPHIDKTGTVARVIDGDTIQLSTGEKVRFVGVNAPEIHQEMEEGGPEAKSFTENLCPPGTVVYLDIDDLEPKDKYGRTLAVVYVKVGVQWINVNAELLRRGLAEILYIPPSEFNPYAWLS